MQKIILKKIDKIIENTGDKILHIPPSKNGKYFDKKAGAYELRHILSTNQAYITGMAIRAYLTTKDEKYLNWCMRLYEEYAKKITEGKYDTTSDVGMLYSLYAVALYKITGDAQMKQLGILAADEVARRFIPNLGYIKSWGRADGNIPDYVDEQMATEPFFCENRGLILIESTINMPILFWAAWETRQLFYSRIAECHIKSVRKYLIRDDFTTRHGYKFEEFKAIPYREENYSGYGVGSYWARGAAISIYSFAQLQKYSHNPEIEVYLNLALKLLDAFMLSCGDRLPVWDFAAPDKTVDTAAAAIVLCAIDEIKKYYDNERINLFQKNMTNAIKSYIDTDMTKDGILREQNGKHEYSVVGDYFIAEAFLHENSLR